LKKRLPEGSEEKNKKSSRVVERCGVAAVNGIGCKRDPSPANEIPQSRRRKKKPHNGTTARKDRRRRGGTTQTVPPMFLE
jgi:hypothetical protein